MNNQIVISADVIDEDTLGDLLSSMKAALEADGYMEKCFFITSDDPKLLAALHNMFDGSAAAAEPVAAKTQKKRKAGKKMARWTVVVGAPSERMGTQLTSQALSKLLTEHGLDVGTVLENPRQGKKVVAVNGSADSPYKLVSTDVEESSLSNQ